MFHEGVSVPKQQNSQTRRSKRNPPIEPNSKSCKFFTFYTFYDIKRCHLPPDKLCRYDVIFVIPSRNKVFFYHFTLFRGLKNVIYPVILGNHKRLSGQNFSSINSSKYSESSFFEISKCSESSFFEISKYSESSFFEISKYSESSFFESRVKFF